MGNYVRPSNILNLKGMNISLPSDRLSPDYCQRALNLRSYIFGEWRQRPGTILIADVDGAAANAVLWERRISDPITGQFRRLVGTAAGDVYVDNAAHTAFTLADSGFDNTPISSFIARPDRSPLPFLFAANSGRLSKFSTTGVRTSWGVETPRIAPSAELVDLAYKVIDACDSATGFVGSGGVVSLQSRIAAVAISQILYDTGTTGWACVAPASMDESWQEGGFVTTSASVETIEMESIYPAIASTTIESIAYDSGSTGLCTIQLAVPTAGLQRNSFLQIGGLEVTRVLSVTLGQDGVPSFRCVLQNTFAAGDAVIGYRSFRAYFANNHAIGETLSASYIQLALSSTGLCTLTKTATLDLSSTNLGASRPIQPDDFIHFGLKVANFSAITEVQLQFDIDAATNDFTQNYFFRSVRQPDLLAAVQQTASSLTSQQQEIQRQQIDDYRRSSLMAERQQLEQDLGTGGMFQAGLDLARQSRLDQIDSELGSGLIITSGQGALSTPAVTGNEQWTEIKIPIKEFQRVGSDFSRGWKDVKAFRISINATATTNIGLDDLWVGGSYGPDSSLGQDQNLKIEGAMAGYNYVARMRCTATGSRSNPSPPLRSPLYPEREAVQLTLDLSTYTDTQADVIDWFRIGGTMGEYHYVGSCPTSSPTFIDTIPDDIALTNAILETDRFRPWVRSDLPKSGTCNVVGTTLTITSGDSFDPSYTAGNQIVVNGKAYTFYAPPATSQVVELSESAGALTNVEWQMPDPTMEGQPLTYVFGPYGGGVFGEFSFGVGDSINPGYLYWLNGNDPESCSDIGYLELTGPSEPLVAGGILDGIVFVWSTVRSFRILPSFSGGQSDAGSLFYSQPTAMGKGLASPWALAFGDQIYFVSWDGIYASRGDAVQSLSDSALAPLFRRDGSEVQGYPFQSISPISFAPADVDYHYLTYSRDGLYWGYKGIDGNLYAFYYSFFTQGWSQDSYSFTASRAFREEGPDVDTLLFGSITGELYQSSSSAYLDGSSPFFCELITREDDFGDTRSIKDLGDQMFDVITGAVAANASLLLDNASSSIPLAQLNTASRARLVRDISFGAGAACRSVAAKINWLSQSGSLPRLYEWQPSALPRVETIIRRVTDWDNAGYDGPKWVQGIRLTADTGNLSKTLRIQGDESLTLADITVQHNGISTKEYSWTPDIAHLLRILGTNDESIRIYNLEWIYEPEPPLATIWQPQATSFDLPGYHQMRDCLLAYRSSADIVLQVIIDGALSGNYLIPNSSLSREKYYFPLKAQKGKLVEFLLTSSAPFSLYLKDLEVRVKPWGSMEPFVPVRPFGDATRTNGGARV